MLSRIDKLRAELAARDLDAFLVTDILNVCYLSGFTGSTAVALITKSDSILITDFRYAEQAESECPGMRLQLVESHWVAGAPEAIESCHAQCVGFESHGLSFHDWMELSAVVSGVHFLAQDDLVGQLRYIKDDGEINLIKEAARIADLAYDHISGVLKPGIRECEIALELEHFMRQQGAEKEAFDSIVASGPRSALPHGKSTGRGIGIGDMVVMDYGAKYQGYHSDITRTVMLGSPDGKQQQIWNIVREAQEIAIAAVRPGISGGDVDAVAREYITSRGHGEHFGHGLGHGLGLDIHDGRILGRRSETVLEPGMVVTVEPGIYIPGWGGVRIEDDVLVTESGAEVLTKAPKTLSLGRP